MLILDLDLQLTLIALLSLIPAIILLLNYLKTSLIDFLLFSMIFFSLTLLSLTTGVVTGTDNLILGQFAQWSLNLTIFSAFVHGLNIRRSPTKIVKIIGFIWFAILQILIFFFKIIIEPPTAYMFCKCLRLEIPIITDNPSYPIGAGIVLSDNSILYSSGYPLISTLFQLFVVITVLYSYIKLKPIIQTKRVKNIKLAMIFVWILFLINTLGNLPWINRFEPETITAISDVCLLSALTLIAFISIRFPETLLISNAQILKARNLFIKFKEDSKNVIEKKKLVYFNDRSFENYLNSIPSELYYGIEKGE